MQLADATNENGVVMTSSPALIPAAIMTACSPAVPEETPTAVPSAGHLRAEPLELDDLGADGKRGGLQHIDNGVDVGLGDVRLREWNRCHGVGE